MIADVMTEMTTRRTTNRTATDANHRANNNSTDAEDQMVERGRDLARLSKEGRSSSRAAGRAARLEGRSKTNSEKPIKEGATGEEQAHSMTALHRRRMETKRLPPTQVQQIDDAPNFRGMWANAPRPPPPPTYRFETPPPPTIRPIVPRASQISKRDDQGNEQDELHMGRASRRGCRRTGVCQKNHKRAASRSREPNL